MVSVLLKSKRQHNIILSVLIGGAYAPLYSMGEIMGFQKFEELKFVYEYDFAQDGGATGAIALRAIGNGMLSGLMVEDVAVFVETAFDDAGDTATVTLGPTGGDADGYLADFMTQAESANSIVRAGEIAGALLWDDTNDHQISYRLSSDSLAAPSITVGTEALTQGKAKFVFTCRRFN